MTERTRGRHAARGTGVALLALAGLAAGCTGDEKDPAMFVPGQVEAARLTSVTGQAGWEKLVEQCRAGETISIEQVKTADLTGDGVRDPFVARACAGVDSMGPATVEVFDGASTNVEPKRLGTVLRDVAKDKPVLNDLAVDGDVVVITASGVDETSDATCPEVSFTYRYRYAANAFTREAREVTPDATCLPDDA